MMSKLIIVALCAFLLGDAWGHWDVRHGYGAGYAAGRAVRAWIGY